MTGFWGGVAALLPPVGVGLVFWVVMRAILQADRRERAAIARLEAEEDAASSPANATARWDDADADLRGTVGDADDPSAQSEADRVDRSED